jgi:hypothetical protein
LGAGKGVSCLQSRSSWCPVSIPRS